MNAKFFLLPSPLQSECQVQHAWFSHDTLGY